MTYVPLPIIEVPVDEIQLDLANYRIPLRPDSEADALKYLFASEDVLGQVKLLLRDGYFDNEVPIVVEESGRYVVLEGNRRVSALKAIRDPSLVPSHERDVLALRTRYSAELDDVPSAIRVIVVPDRDAARPRVARLHTGVPKKRWSRDQQANYYHSLLGPDATFDDLRSRYPDVQLTRFLRMVEMRRFLDGVRFDDASLNDYVKSDDLKMSAFEYAYRNADIAGACGVTFEGYRIQPTGQPAGHIGGELDGQQREAVEYLMNEFRAGRLNTRSPQFKKGTKALEELVDRLLGRTPTGETPGHGQPDDGDPDDGDPDEDKPRDDDPDDRDPDDGDPGADPDDPDGGSPDDDGPGRARRGPNSPDTLQGLSIAGLPIELGHSNLQRRYQELRRVKVGKTPAAAAMLMRSVLEATIKHHFAGSEHAVSGQLSEVMKTVQDVYGKDRRHRDVVNQVKSGPVGTQGSVHWFNAAAHNPDFPILEADVRLAHRRVEPLLKFLLRPYDA